MPLTFDTEYFKFLNTPLKAYILGQIANNIEYICYNEGKNAESEIKIIFQNNKMKKDSILFNNINLIMEIDNFANRNKQTVYYVSSNEIIKDIIEKTGNTSSDINIKYFVSNNSNEIVNYYLMAFFEKSASFVMSENNTRIITIMNKDKVNLDIFSNFYDIPCQITNESVIYKNENALDLIGKIYNNHINIFDRDFYDYIRDVFNLDTPVLNWKKINENAITPIKANYSDVGYDLTAIGISKQINKKTILCNTGIKLEIPSTYYVEIVPRSSIIKSGYMLANSIGIIDSSYKGELLIALIKIDDEASEISFPFRCCQLIMKKQIYPQMVEVSDISDSKRGEGGFGSSG